MITSVATGGDMQDWEFRLLRDSLIGDPDILPHVPKFIRHNVNSHGVWEDMKAYHSGNGAYAARRAYIAREFVPLLDFLQSSPAPADAHVDAILARYDGQAVRAVWSKSLERRERDPEGAITAARTLLEEVCKHILDDAKVSFDDGWDLPKLYYHASSQMNLAPSQHSEEVFKKILGGCNTVVENLGGLRNKIGDAHAGGRARARPAPRHAALAVNLAGSMAMFLIETWEARGQ
jgi:hypothetical protein